MIMKKSTFIAMPLLLAILLGLMVTPVLAHAPSGAGEAPDTDLGEILIFTADEDDLLHISTDDIAEANGLEEMCLCSAAGFRAVSAAISQLYDTEEELPIQGTLKVTYHHPGKGQATTLHYILTEECVTYEKVGNPQNLTAEHFSYVFERTDIDTDNTCELQVAVDDVIPEDFSDLRYKVNGFDNGWHSNEPTQAERDDFAAAWTEARDNFLEMDDAELFQEIEAEEEEDSGFPTTAVIFTSVVCVALIGALGYSQMAKKK